MPASQGESGHVGPTSSPSRARRVGFTESIAQVCHRELPSAATYGAVPADDHPVAVMFDFVDPVRARLAPVGKQGSGTPDGWRGRGRYNDI